MLTKPTNGDLMNLEAELSGYVSTFGLSRVISTLSDVVADAHLTCKDGPTATKLADTVYKLDAIAISFMKGGYV